MAFRSLLSENGELIQIDTKKKGKKKLLVEERGCEHCPLDQLDGVNKIIGRMRGREILVVAQSPGPEDNNADNPRPLVGDGGEFIWTELEAVGITRKECDAFYAVKCIPADVVEGTYRPYLKMRSPSPKEIHCCSEHTDKHLRESKAKQILIFGQVAAKALLKTRSLPMQKTFWSDTLQARVYLLDSPGVFLHQGIRPGTKASFPRLDAFRAVLKRVAADWGMLANRQAVLDDEFAFIRSRKYHLVLNAKAAVAALGVIRGYTSRGRRAAVDIETDDFGNGQEVFAVGVCPKPGLSYVFVFRHKDQDPKDGQAVKKELVSFLEDAEVKKALHYGVSDESGLAANDIQLKGWDHDTNLSEYLVYSDAKAYGLEAIAERRFPEFSGYKLVVVPELMRAAAEEWRIENPDKKLPAIFDKHPDAQLKWLQRKKLIHYRHLSLDTLRLYNGADCDLTKRIEKSNRTKVTSPLMRLYMDLSRVLYRMEPNGPLYDFEQHEKLIYLYPRLARKLRRRIRKKVGIPKFNPGSPDQVAWALWEHFGYKYPLEGKPNTRKGALMLLALKHKFPQLMLDWRSASKVKSILEGYERSARAHSGRLRTKWWATGARTGRLSSGGEKKSKDSTIVNLQNIKKDVDVKNLLVADTRWRRAYEAFLSIEANRYPDGVSHKITDDALLAKHFENWVRDNIPDLKTYLLYDFGQVEIRLLAQLSGDKNLIKDCSESDIHTKVGVTMTGWDPERIRNDEQTRTLTKNVHFGLVYSRGAVNGVFAFVQARSPADMRGRVTREDVERAIKKYFKRYGKVKIWLDSMVEFGREHSYVETMFGMRQNLVVTEQQDEDVNSIEYVDPDEFGGRKSYWANQAVNGPVQGSAHQLLECGLVNLVRQPEKYQVLNVPVAEVHDALYYAVEVLKLPDAYNKGKYLMEKESLNTVSQEWPDIEWRVPVVVDAKAGLRLGGTVKVDDKTSVGQFLVDWFRVTQEQEAALEKLLEKVAA